MNEEMRAAHHLVSEEPAFEQSSASQAIRQAQVERLQALSLL